MGSRKSSGNEDWEYHTLTPERWSDFENLFGKRGAVGGCWCMWWRQTSREFEARKGESNRRAMKRIVASGGTPGILAYKGDEVVGWCSVAPREEFPRLARSRILKPVDNRSVWSVVCFFVAKSRRREGVSLRLLKAAIEYVRDAGGDLLEGYPVEPRKRSTPDLFAFHGLAETFRLAGFEEVARRSETRPIMRYAIDKP